MSLRHSLWVVGLLALSVTEGPNRAAAQVVERPLSTQPQPDRRRTNLVPEPTLMAVLATSLVGLFLAGLQKRRKG